MKRWRPLSLVALTLPALLVVWACSCFAQGLPQSRYSAPDTLRRGYQTPDLTPSNPLGLPDASQSGVRESDSILITPQLFQDIVPLIPNLQLGYLYRFGNDVKSSRLTLDYLLPIELGSDRTVFFEFHNEWQDVWRAFTDGVYTRLDLSGGGGYRAILDDTTLIGINGFVDFTRLGNKFYHTGGYGLEFATLLPGNAALDFSFNYYGNVFDRWFYQRIVRGGPDNFDFQAGYSQQLWEGGPDLRISAAGYKFTAGDGTMGGRGGAELQSRDGMFSLKYEVAHDAANSTYHTVGAFVNVGLQLSNLLNGDNPFSMPEPVFKSPRNLRSLLTRPVKRNFFRNAGAVIRSSLGCQPIVIVIPTSGTYWDNSSFFFFTDLNLNGSGGPEEIPFPKPIDTAILDPNKKAHVEITIKNEGPVVARNTIIGVQFEIPGSGNDVEVFSAPVDIPANESRTAVIPITAADIRGLKVTPTLVELDEVECRADTFPPFPPAVIQLTLYPMNLTIVFNECD